MSFKLLIKEASIWDGTGFSPPTDLLIEEGRIARIGQGISAPGAAAVRAEGCLILPGLVDLRVHLGEPGHEERESVASGLRAAAAGGFTHILAMPDTEPAIDTEQAVALLRQRSAGYATQLHVCAALTKGRAGRELAELAHLKEAGAKAFGDAAPLDDHGTLRRASTYAGMLEIPIFVDASAPTLAADGMVHESDLSGWLGLPGIPAAAESVGVASLLIVGDAFGGRLHLQGISTAHSVRLIRQAKAEGSAVTCATPYLNLLMTEEAIAAYDASAKVNPPLRTEDDIHQLIDAVRAGVIDCIVSGHRPLTAEESDVELEQAPFGAAGLETTLSALYTHLIKGEKLPWGPLIEALCVRPRKVIGLPLSAVTEGADADLTLFDPHERWRVDPTAWRSRGRNSPLSGQELIGRVRGVVRGRLCGGPLEEELA